MEYVFTLLFLIRYYDTNNCSLFLIQTGYDRLSMWKEVNPGCSLSSTSIRKHISRPSNDPNCLPAHTRGRKFPSVRKHQTASSRFPSQFFKIFWALLGSLSHTSRKKKTFLQLHFFSTAIRVLSDSPSTPPLRDIFGHAARRIKPPSHQPSLLIVECITHLPLRSHVGWWLIIRRLFQGHARSVAFD